MHGARRCFALQEAARRHGYPDAQGVALTAEGLRGQAMPLIALIAPGHYVLVEQVTQAEVTYWDGDLLKPPPVIAGVPKRAFVRPISARKTVTTAQWQTLWQGSALALQSVQTGQTTAAQGRQRTEATGNGIVKIGTTH